MVVVSFAGDLFEKDGSGHVDAEPAQQRSNVLRIAEIQYLFYDGFLTQVLPEMVRSRPEELFYRVFDGLGVHDLKDV